MSMTRAAAAACMVDADWSSLSGDLLRDIVMELDLADLFSFARVCTRWRSVAVQSQQEYISRLHPLVVCFLGTPVVYGKGSRYVHGPTDAFYSLSDGRRYRLHYGAEPPRTPRRRHPIHIADMIVAFSCGYWVMREKDEEAAWLFLVHPLTGRVVPGGASFPPVKPGAFDFLCNTFLTSPHLGAADCRLVTVGMFTIWWCRPGDARWSFYKLVFAGPAGMTRLLIRRALCAMVGGNWFIRRALCAVVGGKLYVVSETGALLVFSFPPSGVGSGGPTLEILQTADTGGRAPREAMDDCLALVESEGRLLAVHWGWIHGHGSTFWVYELQQQQQQDEEKKTTAAAAMWVPVHDLGGRALFLDPVRPVLCDPKAWGGVPDGIYHGLCSPRSGVGVYKLTREGEEHRRSSESVRRWPCCWLPQEHIFIIVPSLCASPFDL